MTGQRLVWHYNPADRAVVEEAITSGELRFERDDMGRIPQRGTVRFWTEQEQDGLAAPAVMEFCEDEPPTTGKCPHCNGPLQERQYPRLPDPKAYFDCYACHITWEGFLAPPAPSSLVDKAS